jgi:hypothetical protein
MGPITAVRVNGRKWKQFDRATVFLPYNKTPELAKVEIYLGDAKPGGRASARAHRPSDVSESQGSRGRSPSLGSDLAALEKRADRLRAFERRLAAKGLGAGYAAAHARLAADSVAAAGLRRHLIKEGKIKPLAGASETAADSTYVATATKLCDGLESVLRGYEKTAGREQRQIYEVWVRSGPTSRSAAE